MGKYRNLPKMIKISILDSQNKFCHSLLRGPNLLTISKVSQITCYITPQLGFFGQINFLLCFSLFFGQKCPIWTKKWQFSWFSSLIGCRLVHHCVIFRIKIFGIFIFPNKIFFKTSTKIPKILHLLHLVSSV